MSKCWYVLSSRLQHSRFLLEMALLATILISPVVSFAQVFTATLSGVVSDPSGAGVPAATLTIRKADTSETRQTTSSSDGRYTFLSWFRGRMRLRLRPLALSDMWKRARLW
jgi:hypothetical protein